MLGSHLTFVFASTSLSKFNIVSIAMQRLMQRLGSDPFCVCIFICVIIDAILNCDSDVEANTNADIKCDYAFSQSNLSSTIYLFAFILFYDMFTLHVFISVNVTVKLTLTQRMSSDQFHVFVFASPLT